MRDTSKLMQHDDVTQVQNIVEGIGTGVQYCNSAQVRNALEEYAEHKFPIKTYGRWDVRYNLYKVKLLTDKINYYKDTDAMSYDNIPKDKL